MADYNKVGLFTLRGDRLLLCRKRTLTSKLILPGGAIEDGESDAECLFREIHEELGNVTLVGYSYLGTYLDRAAADDPNDVKTVEIRLYGGELIGEPAASAEIAELIWFGTDDDHALLPPILINKIFPDLIDRQLLPWNSL